MDGWSSVAVGKEWGTTVGVRRGGGEIGKAPARERVIYEKERESG